MTHVIIENGVVVGVLTGPSTDPGYTLIASDDPRIAVFLDAQAEKSK